MNSRYRRAVVLSALLIAAPALAGDTQHTAPEAAEQLATDTETYREHEMIIANPFFEGRAPGTRGNRLAADYIESNYKMLGLKPAFPSEPDADGNTTARSSYRQVFKAPPSSRPGDSLKLSEQAASYSVDGKDITLAPGKDFNVIGFSSSGDATGALAFAGYSIMNEDKDYYSYPTKADLTGKIVMVMRFEPMDDEGHSLWAEQKWSLAAALDPKIREAADHHAAGVILVAPPGADDERASQLGDLGMAGRTQGIPVIMMTREAADVLIKGADKEHRSLLELRKLADKKPDVIDLPGATVTIKNKIEKIDLMTDNVGAILPGKGNLAGEFIVVGSHYDHVGYGYFGSRDPNPQGKVHPGADDNASGTSGNMLLAKKLAAAYKELPEDANARSVLFLAFSAEESGLVGSAFYVKHPIVALNKHFLMLNMDMIGRLRDNKLEVEGVGTAEGLADWCKPYWDGSGLKVKTSAVGMPNSDHHSFYTKSVPNLQFFTGLHKEYHTPKDVVALINFEGAATVVDLVSRIAIDAAQRTEPLKFTDGVTGAHEANQDDQAPAERLGRRVRFGIAPGDYADEQKGVLIGEVLDGLPAQKAGLKAGDRMTKWNDGKLDDVMSLQVAMEKAKPGDKVTITYIRDGKEQTTEATLVGAAGGKQ